MDGGTRKFGGFQVVALLVGFAQGFALLPTSLAVDPPVVEKVEVAPVAGSVAQASRGAPRVDEFSQESRLLVGALQLFSGAFVLWLGFTTIGSMIALYTQAEDVTLLLWAAMGGALGGLLKQFLYKNEVWNLLFTLGLQWGVTLAAAALKFGILKMVY